MKKDIMNIYKEDEIYPYDIDEIIYNGSPVNIISNKGGVFRVKNMRRGVISEEDIKNIEMKKMVYDNEDIGIKDDKIYYVDNLTKMKELVKLLEEKNDSINIHICLEIREFLEFYRRLEENRYIHSIEELSGYVYMQTNNTSKSIMVEVIEEYMKRYPELEEELELFIESVIEMEGIFSEPLRPIMVKGLRYLFIRL